MDLGDEKRFSNETGPDFIQWEDEFW